MKSKFSVNIGKYFLDSCGSFSKEFSTKLTGNHSPPKTLILQLKVSYNRSLEDPFSTKALTPIGTE